MTVVSSQQLVRECACNRLRTAARLVTRRYDDALRGVGVNASQLAVLAAIDVEGAGSITDLSKRLGMDRTTLSRNLKPLTAAGFVKLGDEGRNRARTVTLSDSGRAVLKGATERWVDAQEGFLARVGNDRWSKLDLDLLEVISLL